ncbi:hypothetical protein HPP92_010328 [Vanilla planifolia]|uniref:Uncharacterized protein n=1 Tax=Vanilla planifolia TaxID=51239 RepID=A0A835V0P8_VANPL|nr:hypothetical protein HPP92_010328 [Vanilla planifolia]
MGRKKQNSSGNGDYKLGLKVQNRVSRLRIQDGRDELCGYGGGIEEGCICNCGTTCFDALVKSVDSQNVRDELWKRGYTNLLIQMGRGCYIPSKISEKLALSMWTSLLSHQALLITSDQLPLLSAMQVVPV